MSSTGVITDFKWDEVTFDLDNKGNFEVTENVQKAWEKHGFVLIKNMFSNSTIQALDACSKDSIIQVKPAHSTATLRYLKIVNMDSFGRYIKRG